MESWVINRDDYIIFNEVSLPMVIYSYDMVMPSSDTNNDIVLAPNISESDKLFVPNSMKLRALLFNLW